MTTESVLIRSKLDETVLGELFDAHYNALYNFCFRQTADWSLAEELASETFLEAWRKRESVDLTVENARSWLFGVALNVLRNRRRGLRRFQALLSRIPAEGYEPDFSDGVVSDLEDQRRMREILLLFKRLSTHDQEVISLCDWSGISHIEAAVALEISVGTVRSRLFRARKRFNKLTAAHYQEPEIAVERNDSV